MLLLVDIMWNYRSMYYTILHFDRLMLLKTLSSAAVINIMNEIYKQKQLYI